MINGDYRQAHTTLEAAHRYRALYVPGTYDSWVWELEKAYLVSAVRRHLGSRRTGIRLLDFACGTGRVLAFLEPMTREATGVDVSGAMLALAEQQVRKAKLVCADITKVDTLPAGAYDLVTAFRFFLNADDALRDEALKAIRRVLTDDGIFITNIHGNLWSLRLIGYLFRRCVLRQRVNVMSAWTMKRLLARNGFDVVEVAGLGWPTQGIYRLIGRRWCEWSERAFSRVRSFSYLTPNVVLVCRKIARDSK